MAIKRQVRNTVMAKAYLRYVVGLKIIGKITRAPEQNVNSLVILQPSVQVHAKESSDKHSQPTCQGPKFDKQSYLHQRVPIYIKDSRTYADDRMYLTVSRWILTNWSVSSMVSIRIRISISMSPML